MQRRSRASRYDLGSAPGAFADTVRIAMIETFSGPFAPLGQNHLETANTK